MEQLIGQFIALWLLIAGIAWMLGGEKAAKKVMTVPMKFVGRLVLDLASAIGKLAFELADKGLRALGRFADRKIRKWLRLAPPCP